MRQSFALTNERHQNIRARHNADQCFVAHHGETANLSLQHEFGCIFRACFWRDHYWKEFNGYNHAFRDPWGNEIILWGKAGPEPKIPDNFTRE